MSLRISAGVTPKGQYYVHAGLPGCGIIRTTNRAAAIIKARLFPDKQEATEALAIPQNFCKCCLLPVYKGVRINRQECFCAKCYESYDWVQFYMDREPELTAKELYHLSVEKFTDNGHTSTLIP